MFITIGLTNKECDTTHAPAALPFGFTPTEQLGVQTPGCRMVAPAGRLPDAAAELPPGSCASSRLGGGAAKPRCCAALALTQPPPAKGLYSRGGRFGPWGASDRNYDPNDTVESNIKSRKRGWTREGILK